MIARLLVLAVLHSASGMHAQERARFTGSNPIRRVVDMLQKMQTKVEEEGKSEKKLFDKFMCYCRTGVSDLQKSIRDAETRGPQAASAGGQAKALKEQLAGELKQHQASRQDAKDTIAQATALREKEAADFARESADGRTNAEALAKAIAALEKGTKGSFLQTSAAATLQRLSITLDMSSSDRDLLSSFLTQGQEDNSLYSPQSGSLVGILKQMQETMKKNLADAQATEQQRVADFKAMVAAKESEIEANTQAIESKMERAGALGVEIVTLEEDGKDTAKALAADKQFLADLEKNCAAKQQEWDERSKTRADELVALADTIKILNDDEALDLFKETLPSPALLQVQFSARDVKQRALQALSSRHGRRDNRVDLIALELTGRSGNFDQVLKMIDGMVDVLGKEQGDDDAKKAYCVDELDKAEDTKKELDRSASDLGVAIEDAKETLSRLEEELKGLVGGVEALDKSVAKATENRKAENEEFQKAVAADNAAKQLLDLAKNRLAKFYTPKLYKQPTFSQLTAHRAAPGPPPETWGAYQSKGEESAGVLAMIDALKADLDKDLQEATVDEKHAQKQYEQFIADSASKRAADTASITQKEGAKADLEVQLQKLASEHKATVAEAMAKGEYIADLHQDCDWLVSNYDVRKEARASEVDSLKKAKAVLSGADYSLVQTASAHKLHLRGRRL